MPALGNHLNFAQYEARNVVVHNGNPNPPSGNVKGQLWFNNSSNELFYWDGTIWQSAKSGAGSSGPPSGPAGGDLTGTYPNPTIAPLKVTDAHVAAANKDGAAGTPSMRTLGTGAGQAMAGNTVVTPPDATTGSKGVVQLAGDLAGTAASPQIAAGVITDAEVAAANKDGAGATPSLRTLGLGAQQAFPGNSRLDMLNPPIVAVGFNNQKASGLADPTVASDAATKQYVDNTAQGLDAKQSVKAATTTNITLSGTQTVDGVALIANDRVLVKNQPSPAPNGIYVVAAGAWTRATDMDNWAEVPSAFVFVEQGTVNADTGWVAVADQGGTLGTTGIDWTQFSGAGTILGGLGLTKTGTSLDVGAGPGITVNADTVQVANDGITNAMLADGAVNLAGNDVTGTLPLNKGGTNATTAAAARTALGATGYYTSATHGAGATITVTAATHGLGAGRGKLVQVQDEASGNVVLADVSVAANGDVSVTFGASVSANTYRVTVIG